MNNYKELLELAAKAINLEDGYEWNDDPFYTGLVKRNNEDGFEMEEQRWNPLIDDGDALRLAVKLFFNVEVQDGYTDVVNDAFKATREDHDNPYAATRRAIVRAAAEIGKEMT